MTYDEVEIVADAGTRLRIIADGMHELAEAMNPGAARKLLMGRAAASLADSNRKSWVEMARHVDEVRVRLCALPIESEGGEGQ